MALTQIQDRTSKALASTKRGCAPYPRYRHDVPPAARRDIGEHHAHAGADADPLGLALRREHSGASGLPRSRCLRPDRRQRGRPPRPTARTRLPRRGRWRRPRWPDCGPDHAESLLLCGLAALRVHQADGAVYANTWSGRYYHNDTPRRRSARSSGATFGALDVITMSAEGALLPVSPRSAAMASRSIRR
jgi:hypothetical protein